VKVDYDELYKQIGESARKDIAAFEQLTLSQVRDLIGLHIDPDQAIADAALAVVTTMEGKNTQQMVATGLSLILMGMELLAKDVTVIPNFVNERSEKEKGNE
jgi:hypothetical protein